MEKGKEIFFLSLPFLTFGPHGLFLSPRPNSPSPSLLLGPAHSGGNRCRTPCPARPSKPRLATVAHAPPCPAADAWAPLVGAAFFPARLGTARARPGRNRRPRTTSWERPLAPRPLQIAAEPSPAHPAASPARLHARQAPRKPRNRRSVAAGIRRLLLRTDRRR